MSPRKSAQHKIVGLSAPPIKCRLCSTDRNGSFQERGMG